MGISGSTSIWHKLTLYKDIDGEIKQFNLLKSLVSVEIKESINNNFLSGVIRFRDLDNVFLSTPFTGNEKIEMKVECAHTDVQYSLEFYCIETNPMNVENNNDIIKELTIVEKGWEKFFFEYSTAVSNEKISDFVSRFSSNVLGRTITNIEKTDSNKCFAIPYMRFKNILTYLNQYAVSDQGYNDYKYFTNLLGEVSYVTLSWMLKQKQKIYLNEVSVKEANNHPANFSYYTLDNDYNLINIMLDKGMGSTQIKYDQTNKSVVTTENTFENLISNNKHLGKFSIINPITDAEKAFHYRASTSNNKSEIGFTRNEQKYAMAADIYSDGLLQRRAGTLAKISFKNHYDKTNNNVLLNGLYLIETINHIFYPGAYSQVITAINTSYYGKKAISPNQVNL
jgi:hypothetical protein